MKHLIYAILAGFLLTTSAYATNNTDTSADYKNYYSNYGNSFIFMEDGIEFSVFPDGQFDFYIPRHCRNVSFNAYTNHVTFNSGYNYNPFLQYDEYGAIVQIEYTPIYYDFYGRVRRIGNVRIDYNHYGRIRSLGNLFIHYNNRRFSHCTGYINSYNRLYISKPWHRHYMAPRHNYRVVHHSPYRRNYTPRRYKYTRPFVNNSRRRTAIANRRGNTISRNRSYATVRNTSTPRRRSEDISRRPTRRHTSTIPSRSGRSNVKRSTATTTRGNTSKIRRNSSSRSIRKDNTNRTASASTSRARRI